MSKIYEEYIIPEKKSKRLVCHQCDLCGLKSNSYDWETGIYEINETEISIRIKQKEGKSYPEGGSGYEYEIDLCPNCFKNRLVPWLKSEGAYIEQKCWDW